MILTLTLPQISIEMRTATIQSVYPTLDAPLAIGSKLVDVKIDLSHGILHDCPPISFYRIALREQAFLRQLLIQKADEVPPMTMLAIFSTDPDEKVDIAQARPLRISVFGIVPQNDLWSTLT